MRNKELLTLSNSIDKNIVYIDKIKKELLEAIQDNEEQLEFLEEVEKELYEDKRNINSLIYNLDIDG